MLEDKVEVVEPGREAALDLLRRESCGCEREKERRQREREVRVEVSRFSPRFEFFPVLASGAFFFSSFFSSSSRQIECREKTRQKTSPPRLFKRTCSSLYTFSYADVQSSNAERGLACRVNGVE